MSKSCNKNTQHRGYFLTSELSLDKKNEVKGNHDRLNWKQVSEMGSPATIIPDIVCPRLQQFKFGKDLGNRSK